MGAGGQRHAGIYSLDDYDFRKPNAWLFRRSRTRRHRNRAASTCTTGRVALWRQAMRSSTPASVRSAGRLSISRFRPPPRRRALRRATFSPDQRAVLQRQRRVSGDGGGLPLRGEPLRERRGETIHRTDFSVIPASVSYRPAQSTAWPRTYGPQTAKVVGPQGRVSGRTNMAA